MPGMIERRDEGPAGRRGRRGPKLESAEAPAGAAAPAQGPAAVEGAAGVGQQAGLEARLVALEARVAALEGGAGEVPGIESILARVLPPDALGHMKTARREDLLAVRSVIDAWIARLDRPAGSRPQARPPVKRRESISLE